MLFANAAPTATRKPIATRVPGSVALKINAAFEAMKRFEGPANGIKLNPKEVSNTTSSSVSGAIPTPSLDLEYRRRTQIYNCAQETAKC